jgi:hypothetical protein
MTENPHNEDATKGYISSFAQRAGNESRLTDRLAPLFDEAVFRHCQGERITWEIGMFFFPSGQGENVGAGLGVHLSVPGMVMNTVIAANQILNPAGLSQETVDITVRSMIEGLLQARSQQPEAMQRAQQQAQQAANGHSPIGGLIVP